MPVVAVMWGVFDGERFGWHQVLSAGIVLLGVYLAHQSKKSSRSKDN
jgi:drug/metabolite transporter (DMT)-like permease